MFKTDGKGISVKWISDIASLRKGSELFSFTSEFNEGLERDNAALIELQNAARSGKVETAALSQIMANASLDAKKFASSNDMATVSINNYLVKQRQSQVAIAAQDTSLKNCDSIIRTYNTNLDKTGLTQEQFSDAVKQSNPILGNYLSTVKSGEASTKGYVGQLVKAKIASVGLTAATTLLNAALTLGISFAIQGVIQLIDYFAKSQERANEAVKEAAQDLSELKGTLKSLDDYKDKISGLRDELDNGNLSLSEANKKREELLSIQDELIDKYGKEKEAIESIRDAVLGETDALDQLSKKQMDKWLTNNKDAILKAKDYASEQLTVNVLTSSYEDPITAGIIHQAIIEAGVAEPGSTDYYNEISFYGTREEIVEKIAKFREWLREYCRKNNISTDLRDNLLYGLDDQENYITDNNAADGNYNNQMSVYKKAIEYETAINHSELYKSLTRSKKQYEDALLSSDKELADAAYNSFQKSFYDFFAKVNNKTESLTDSERAYIVRLKQDLEKEFSPVIKLDLEGTKQEFRSSYEELAKIYEKVGDEGFNFDEDSFDILEHYNEVLKEAKESSVDLNKTVFGNIDTNNRQLLEWTEENLNKYEDAYKSLGWTAEELRGSISTVMGMADEFDGVNIAFTPMLQTDHGAVLLDADTVHEYIWALIDQMPEGWTNEDLLKLDAEGIEMDGQKIKGLIADIGETAIKTSESMHFVGKDGAIADAYKYWQEYVKENKLLGISVEQASEFNAIRDAANEAGVSIESYIEALVKCGKVRKESSESGTEELSISKYSEDIKKAQEAISPLLDAYNKLQKGELSSSDIITLISDKFPSLINYTDDLGVGIQKLAWEKLEALKNKLNEIDKSKLSKSDLEAYNKFIEYIDNLNDGFRSTLAYYEKIQATTKKVSESITTLISLSKEIDEDGGLSLSSIDKIMSDESLASLRPYLNDVKSMLPIINSMIEEQKQAYVELYNEQQRLANPEAYKEAAEEKVEADEKAFSNAIKKIDDAVKHFKEKYDVDVTNWEQIEDGKKAILENTNAQLVGKQQKLINDFAKYYNTDLENFKNITEAKQAILDEFATSKAGQAINDFALNMYQGRYVVKEWDSLTSVEQKIVQQYLTQLGWTYNDYKKFAESGFKEVTSKGDESLKKKLAEIVTAYTISPDTWNDATKNIGSSSKGSSSKEKTWFEKQYAYHNHMVNMEQEKQQDYLNWLDGAYKQAYNQGIIDLDAYYKYEEEVYNGRKKLAGDTSNWFEKQYKEHQHLLKMEKEDEADYLKWLDAAYKKAYAEGLITLDDYRKYQEEVYEGVKRLKDNAESAIKELINIRINMLKEEVNKEKESINKRLDMLKDFYQKQKDMLQDKYDQEKYLDEQNEKRKKVSDIQAEIEALRMDDSAKAQKKRAELAVDLKDAQKELNDFEKDHTLKEAQDQLDKLYENQEKEYNKKLDDLEKKVSSPQELYEQALADIRNGSQSLYNQMIEWNNVYGDGIRETITKAWEEAYKAEKQYFNYTGKHFNDVNLSNATGYVKGKSGYASGTRHSIAGLHRVDEQGVETIFQSADGQRYRMFSSGEKVLNANASDFLYKFANKGKEILENLFHGTSRSYNNVNPGVAVNNVQLGDIIIQGNADRATVSEIRRAQRENLEQMLKQFNRLK